MPVSEPSSDNQVESLNRAYMALVPMDNPPVYQVWTLAEKALLEAERLEREGERLRAALTEAHRQLSLHDFKGPKQVGRALMTMERALNAP